MITVRFATGFSIQYNDGHYVTRDSFGYTCIYNEKGGNLIAQVPTASCIIEWARPCRTYSPIKDPTTLGEQVLDQLKDLPDSTLVALKRKLSYYDLRTQCWKNQ